jgi:hypothetical protein
MPLVDSRRSTLNTAGGDAWGGTALGLLALGPLRLLSAGSADRTEGGRPASNGHSWPSFAQGGRLSTAELRLIGADGNRPGVSAFLAIVALAR